MTTAEIESRIRAEELEAAAWAAELSGLDYAQWLASEEGIRAMDELARKEATNE